MSSIQCSWCRPTTFKTTTEQCLVALSEVFDNSDSTTADAHRFLNREELPNERITLHLCNVGLLVNDWKSFKRELVVEGLELTIENRNLRVSGYAPRNDYNGKKEIKAIMVKYLKNSKSFP